MRALVQVYIAAVEVLRINVSAAKIKRHRRKMSDPSNVDSNKDVNSSDIKNNDTKNGATTGDKRTHDNSGNNSKYNY